MSSHKAPSFNQLKQAQLAHGIAECRNNAVELIEEAELLLKHGRVARAYTLTHLAREELAKVSMLFRAAISVMVGEPVGWKELNGRFRDHKRKLVQDRLDMLLCCANVIEPKFVELMIGLCGLTADVANNRKNESLYTTWDGEAFRRPSEVITQRQAERSLELARFALSDVGAAGTRLEYWSAKPQDEVRDYWLPRFALIDETAADLPKTPEELVASLELWAAGEITFTSNTKATAKEQPPCVASSPSPSSSSPPATC